MADSESGEALFVGTNARVRDLFLALATAEPMESFCARTGVSLDAARSALELASSTVPRAALSYEEWQAHLDSLLDRTSMDDTWWSKPFFKFMLDKAMPVVLSLSVIFLAIVMIMLATGVIRKTVRPTNQGSPARASTISMPETVLIPSALG